MPSAYTPQTAAEYAGLSNEGKHDEPSKALLLSGRAVQYEQSFPCDQVLGGE